MKNSRLLLQYISLSSPILCSEAPQVVSSGEKKEREILNLPNLPHADSSSFRLSVGNPKPVKVQVCSLFVVPAPWGQFLVFSFFTQYLILDFKKPPQGIQQKPVNFPI